MEDPRAWVHWNRSFDMRLSYPGPVSLASPSWIPQSALLGVTGVAEGLAVGSPLVFVLSFRRAHCRFDCSGLTAATSFVYWCGRQHFSFATPLTRRAVSSGVKKEQGFLAPWGLSQDNASQVPGHTWDFPPPAPHPSLSRPSGQAWTRGEREREALWRGKQGNRLGVGWGRQPGTKLPASQTGVWVWEGQDSNAAEGWDATGGIRAAMESKWYHLLDPTHRFGKETLIVSFLFFFFLICNITF